jgi:hypothetical protein
MHALVGASVVQVKGVPQICGDSGDGGDCPHVTSPDKTFVGKDQLISRRLMDYR